MANRVSLKATVQGHVQGVFFRAFVEDHAIQLGLTGFVRNSPNEREVEVSAEGEKEQLEKLLEYLNIGPPAARIEKVITHWGEFTGKYSHFAVKY